MNNSDYSLQPGNGLHVTLNRIGGNITSLVAPKGRFPHRLGMQVVDDAALERILTDLRSREQDVVVDYDHGSMDHTATSSGSARAAGWIKPSTARVTPKGITAVIRWTGKAERLIGSGEYRYLSPVFEFDPEKSAEGELSIKRLVNAGLTNNPNIGDMKPLNDSQEEKRMDLLEKIVALLKLDSAATEEDVFKAISGLLEKRSETDLSMNGLFSQLAVNNLTEATRKITELSKPPLASEGEIVLLREKLKDYENRETVELVNNALSEGKISPYQKQWAIDYAASDKTGFSNYLQNALAVPISVSVTEKHRNGSGSISEAEKEILDMFSTVTTDDYLSIK